MKFSFDDEQLELKKSARKFLATASSSERIRAAMTSETGYDEGTWATMAGELGWLALTIPEEYDGFGLGPVSLVPLLEEMGRANYAGPFFSTVCLGASALVLGGSDAQKKEYLPAIAAGELLVTLAHTEASGRQDAEGITTVAKSNGGGFVLDGVKRFVLDGHVAGLVLVAARLEGTKGEDGITLFAVPADAPGLTRTALPTIDQTRRLAEIRFEGVRVDASSVLGGTDQAGKGASLLAKVLDRACAALAAEQVGGAEACLDMAVEYAKVRKQFGKPIGTFQAIQHAAANMLLRVESAKSAAYYAAAMAADDSPELAEASAIAKSYASEAFFHCASENIQIHGGIGFTWEHDAPIFFKRARAGEFLLGEPSYHRERIARAIGL